MAEEVFSLHYITRLGEDVMDPNPKKVSIYVSYCPNNLDEVRRLAKKILEKNPAIIYFRRYDLDPTVNFEDLKVMISQSQVTVVLVTPQYLEKNSIEEDYNKEYQYLKSSHIPFLPIITIGVSPSEYEKTFGTIQYLDLDQHDQTQISIDKKLENYFKLYIVKDDDYMVAKSAFKNFVFLSYRKKDRAEALKLIDEIHKNEECQDIAIWYDEFLVAGEAFEKKLERKLKKCNALLLCVTPNLVNEDNYVREVEYKYAHEVHKTVLPIKAVDTSLTVLKQVFIDIPDPVEASEASTALINITKVEARKTTPRKMYALGVAYLFGIEVEINRSIALSYLEKAANKGYIEALRFLADIYMNGNGVIRDIDKAKEYMNRLVEKIKKGYTFDLYESNADNYYSERVLALTLEFATPCKEKIQELIKTYQEMKSFKKADEIYEYNWYSNRLYLQYTLMAMSFSFDMKFNPKDYLNDLDEMKKLDEDDYQLFYSYYFHYFEFDHFIHTQGVEALSEYEIKTIRFLSEKFSDEFLGTVILILSKVTESPYLDINTKNKVLHVCKEEVAKYKDDENMPITLVQLQLGEITTNAFNPMYDFKKGCLQLEKLLANCHTYLTNNFVILSAYYVLAMSASDDTKQFLNYARQALDYCHEMSDDVQNGIRAKEIRYDLETKIIIRDESLSEEERVEKLKTLTKKLLKEESYGCIPDAVTPILTYEYKVSNLKDYEEYYLIFKKHYQKEVSGYYYHRCFLFDALLYSLRKDETSFKNAIDQYMKDMPSFFGSDANECLYHTINVFNDLVTSFTRLDSFELEGTKCCLDKILLNFKKEHFKPQSRLIFIFIKFVNRVLGKFPSMMSHEAVDFVCQCYEDYVRTCEINDESIDELTNEYIRLANKIFLANFKQNKEKTHAILRHFYDNVSLAFTKAQYKQFRFSDLGQLYCVAYYLEYFFHEKDLLQRIIEQTYNRTELLDLAFESVYMLRDHLNKEDRGKIFLDATNRILFLFKEEQPKSPLYILSTTIYRSVCSFYYQKMYQELIDLLPLIIKKYQNESTYVWFIKELDLIILFTKTLLNKEKDYQKEIMDRIPLRKEEIEQANLDCLNFQLVCVYEKLVLVLEKKYLSLLYSEIRISFGGIQKNAPMLNESQGDFFGELYGQALEDAKNDFSNPLFIDLVRDRFSRLDVRYEMIKPSWYLKLKVRVAKIFFDALLKEGNKRKLLMDFYSLLNYLGVTSDAPITRDLSKQFPDILSIGMKIDHEFVNNKDSTFGLYLLGLRYFDAFFESIPFECYHNFFKVSYELGVITSNFIPFVELSNPHSTLSLEETMKVYQDLFNGLMKKSKTNVDNIIIFFLRRYFDYLNKNAKEKIKDYPDIKEEFRLTCERLSFYYEKKDNLPEAYEYQELSKKYRS